MRSKYAWLLLPPLLALIVFFGPMQSLNNSDVTAASKTGINTAGNANNAAVGTNPGDKPGDKPTSDFRSEIGSQLPEMPGLWQIGSTLIGVVLLGVVVVLVLRKFKENSAVPVSVFGSWL